MSALDGPMAEGTHSSIGGVAIDEVTAGDVRVKRVVYPAGWRWSTSMQQVTGTDRCMHAHVGFLAQGAMTVEFADGCTEEFRAPAFVVVEPGHDGWVTGDDPAVLVQVDGGPATVEKFGLLGAHVHQ
jgi:hypothetical protein